MFTSSSLSFFGIDFDVLPLFIRFRLLFRFCHFSVGKSAIMYYVLDVDTLCCIEAPVYQC